MFVLSETGQVYMYIIKEIIPRKEDLALFGSKAATTIKGELQVQIDPIQIKGVGHIKQIACGLDHILLLDKDGELMTMGDDTFG